MRKSPAVVWGAVSQHIISTTSVLGFEQSSRNCAAEAVRAQFETIQSAAVGTQQVGERRKRSQLVAGDIQVLKV